MAKVAISGYYGFKNFGDEAILSVLVNHLKALGADVTVFSSDTKFTTDTYNVNSVKRFDIHSVVKTIKNSDILISGGGSLLQDTTSLKSIIYYLFIIALGILFSKKVIIFAQGIGPINNLFAKFITKNLLKLCSYVSVRDQNSYNLLKNWNVDVKLVCDPIYSVNVPYSDTTGIIGIQLREFKTMNYNLIHKLAMLVASKFTNYKVKIFSLQETQDLDLAKQFEHLLHTLNSEISTDIITDDIIENLSKLEYLIAMRFHALLVAMKAGVKSCAINYDIKVEKLANDASIPEISMDASENFEEIFDALKNLNKDDLLRFANSKSFDWTDFDNLF